MSDSTLLEDLISWWSMEDDPDTGFQTDELERNKLTGVSLTQVPGRVGNAVAFGSDGNSTLQCNSNAMLQLENRPFTFACWVLFYDFVDNPNLISKQDSSPISSGYQLHYDTFTTAIAFRVGNAGLANVVLAFSSQGPPIGQWQFVIAWLDAPEGYLHIRMNDSNYENISVNPMLGGMDVNTLRFNIGNGHGANSLNGAMDQVAIWGRTLTREEQSYLWNDGEGRSYCDLLDTNCKSIICCDRKSYDYVASAASEA